nr:MAG TPA: Sporulation protein Cse60 [Caudoviricetes sp.]
MVKVIAIKEENLYDLEAKINNFTRNNKIEVVDIKFEVAYVSTYKQLHYALIMYRKRQING